MAPASAAVPLAGLEAHLGAIPAGMVILLEGGLAPGKNHLAHAWAASSAAAGRKAAYLHTDPHPSPAAKGVRSSVVHEWSPKHARPGEDVAVDSFSLLHVDERPSAVAAQVRDLKVACRRNAATAVLVLDDDQLHPGAHSACQQMADGVVQFGAREDADGTVTFLRVPKWLDGKPRERHLFYSFDGKRLLVDIRRRVN